MGILLQNALLVDLDPPGVETGTLRIEADRIAARGPQLSAEPGDEVVDCGGAVVLPGLINGHTHLYAALSAGMPPPPQPPRNFRENLEYVWWRLDRAHDAESIELSACVGALDALRCGTTALIDHHASPNCIAGSLDALERGLDEVGLRAVLCYETTDRNGRDGALAGLEENRRYLGKCLQYRNHRFAGLVGAHALFTLEDETLDHVAGLAFDFETGVHMHVAEDPCDEEACQAQHQMFLIDRLAAHRLLQLPDSIFVHGTHLDAEARARIAHARITLAHNPRSNMNNAVGYASPAAFPGVTLLGTDGHGSDMFVEARAAWYVARHEGARLAPGDLLRMLAANARRVSAALDLPLGRLEPGMAADIVVTDYRPATPLTAGNLAAHFLFALGAHHVASVLVGGQWKLRDRRATGCDEAAVRAAAAEVAARLWERMQRLD